eukprot:Lithocolla_globosa_v1_NODE_31_length_8897_cov_62.719634.p8 type:complete len:100 gc:universal NODE_31_length_8897_cov_62.719634:728-1027(+)
MNLLLLSVGATSTGATGKGAPLYGSLTTMESCWSNWSRRVGGDKAVSWDRSGLLEGRTKLSELQLLRISTIISSSLPRKIFILLPRESKSSKLIHIHHY